MTDEKTIDYSTTWSSEALIAKAQRYAEKMLECSRDDWEFALWSSLTLEFLLRAIAFPPAARGWWSPPKNGPSVTTKAVHGDTEAVKREAEEDWRS